MTALRAWIRACYKSRMTSTLPPFPQSFLDARDKANAAWEAEYLAWGAMGGSNSPPMHLVMAWHQVRGHALDAQEAFDREVDQWRRLANLG